MIEVFRIFAGSVPIAIMVVVIVVAVVVNRRLKQAMDDSQTIRDLRASKAMTVKHRDDAG